MSSGKTVRLNRLLASDGKTAIAALDHGMAGIAPLGALARLDLLIPELIAAGIDAVIVTPGALRKFAGLFGKLGIVVRVDCGPTALTKDWKENRPAVSVEDVLRLGADAVIAMGIAGAPGESQSLQALTKLAGDCHQWGMVLVAEMLPGGFGAVNCPAEQISVAARVGAELGADIIKISYSGSRESFRAVTENCYRPVVVLGGSKQEPEQLTTSVMDAMAAGAAGVAVGRNIWESKAPGAIARKLVEVVHG